MTIMRELWKEASLEQAQLNKFMEQKINCTCAKSNKRSLNRIYPSAEKIKKINNVKGKIFDRLS